MLAALLLAMLYDTGKASIMNEKVTDMIYACL
jgi:hypothetical protein